MHIAANNVSIGLDDDDIEQLRAMVGGGEEHLHTVVQAASKALRHVLEVCSTASDKPPILTDMHVFLASKLMEEESAPIDREAISTVLTAWQAAEGLLDPDARKALRLLEPLVMEVLHAKDKRQFEQSFHDKFIPRLPLKAASFLRTYIEVLQSWALESAVPEEGAGHYLENTVARIYQGAMASLRPSHSRDYTKKRLAAAKDALDSYIFE